MNQPKIKLENVGKIFNTRGYEMEALRDINIDVYDHEFVSIIGPSGCGKSTIIRLLDDIIKPTSGRIVVDGFEYDHTKPIPKEVIRKFGFVFQNPNLLPWLTIKENMMFPLKVFREKDPKWEKVVDELLEIGGLTEVADQYPLSLSGGMTQRVGALRAMTFQPPILLMDEPYGTLDEIMREQLDMETMRLWEQLNQTIIFITHNVKEAVLVSDKVYVLDTQPGRVVEMVNIDLPRPRTHEMTATPEYMEYVAYLTAKIGEVDLSQVV